MLRLERLTLESEIWRMEGVWKEPKEENKEEKKTIRGRGESTQQQQQQKTHTRMLGAGGGGDLSIIWDER